MCFYEGIYKGIHVITILRSIFLLILATVVAYFREKEKSTVTRTTVNHLLI